MSSRPNVSHKYGKRKFKRRYRSLKKRVQINEAKIKQLKSTEEKMYRDQTFTETDIQTNMGTQILTGVVQKGAAVASTPDLRVGNEVYSKAINIRGYIANNGTTPVDAVCRIMVVKAIDVSNANPANQSIIRDTYTGATYSVHSLRNLDETYNHKMIFDRTYFLDTQAHSTQLFDIDIKTNHKIMYDDTDGDVTAAEANHYFLFYISDHATDANCPHLYFKWRHKFSDA